MIWNFLYWFACVALHAVCIYLAVTYASAEETGLWAKLLAWSFVWAACSFVLMFTLWNFRKR